MTLDENVKIVHTVLYEWGSAIRNNWAFIDGRQCRSQIQDLADCLNSKEPLDIQEVRGTAGVCPDGHGWWGMDCNENGCTHD